MKGFFINGTFSVDTNRNYSMRFLYELEYDFILNIYTDKKKNILLITHIQSNPEFIVNLIDIEINYPKINILGYKRFYYEVINKKNDKKEYNGSFPIISLEYKEDLKIVFLSCNDNLSQVKK